MAIKLGSVVEVVFRKKTTDPAYMFNGMCFMVKNRKSFRNGNDTQYMYELYGAESEYGSPYTFREENLKEVSESRLTKVDIQEGDKEVVKGEANGNQNINGQ